MIANAASVEQAPAITAEAAHPKDPKTRVTLVGIVSAGSFVPRAVEIDAATLDGETAARAWLLGQGFRVR